MKKMLVLGLILSSFQVFACEPSRVTQQYSDQIDSIGFTFGTTLKANIEGELLTKNTAIKLKGNTIREVNFAHIKTEQNDNITTSIHKITIGAMVDTAKGLVYMTQSFEVKNSFDEACNRLKGPKDEQVSGDEIMAKFSRDYIENHTTYIKNSGDVDYNLAKFSNGAKVAKALEKEIEEKSLTLTKKNPRANYTINVEMVSEVPLSCTVKGSLVSQQVLEGEKTTLELDEVRAVNCSQAIKKISRVLPKL